MNLNQIFFPLDNQEFLKVITNSFYLFIDVGTSRSTAKLKPLHGSIARDLAIKFGGSYNIVSQGYGKEETIYGRYIDKKVDITICKDSKPIAGIAVKFVMQNYSQNSNNYFENMLGETANIRSKHYPYFQIFIILNKLPYYKKDKTISKWETFTIHNVHKYKIMSNNDANIFYHTPDKTLIHVVSAPDCSTVVYNEQQYNDYYKQKDFIFETANVKTNFGRSVILNDWVSFREKIYHRILSI